MHDLAIISGTSNTKLATNICEKLGIDAVNVITSNYGNGECRVEINDNVRNKDVFVIQSASDKINDHLMELLLILDALKRSSIYRVTVVMPCMPYARSDRKVKSRVPISAKLVADLIQTAGADRFVTAELHAPQIAGFFNIPVDNLYTSNIFLDKIRENHPNNNICIVAPDAGSVKVVKKYAGRLDCDVAMIYKNRSAPGMIKEMSLIGNVANANCIVVDDMADTCLTLSRAADLLINCGAKSVTAYCTHPVLSGDGVSNINKSQVQKLFVTNTIDNPNILKYNSKNKIEILDSSALFAEAIKCIHEEKSLAHLFNEV